MTKPVQITQTLRAWMDVFMHRSMRGWTHFAKSTGLSMPQFSILMQLHHKGPCGLSEISERFDVTAAAASQLVDKLVQAGYLEREEDPHDRRAKLLTLSDTGRALIDQGTEERYRWMEELAVNINMEERGRVVEALEILTKAAQQLEEKK
ncbi:MAG: MarR family transcriptional regulator [Anaerolineaceae bacterium]|nr:MAG: MarR family transcriptional regulator [Anaerolineaceae bacterium]